MCQELFLKNNPLPLLHLVLIVAEGTNPQPTRNEPTECFATTWDVFLATRNFIFNKTQKKNVRVEKQEPKVNLCSRLVRTVGTFVLK